MRIPDCYLRSIPFTGINESCRRVMLGNAKWHSANGPARLAAFLDRIHPWRWIESTPAERGALIQELNRLLAIAPNATITHQINTAWEGKDDDVDS